MVKRAKKYQVTIMLTPSLPRLLFGDTVAIPPRVSRVI